MYDKRLLTSLPRHRCTGIACWHFGERWIATRAKHRPRSACRVDAIWLYTDAILYLGLPSKGARRPSLDYSCQTKSLFIQASMPTWWIPSRNCVWKALIVYGPASCFPPSCLCLFLYVWDEGRAAFQHRRDPSGLLELAAGGAACAE